MQTYSHYIITAFLGRQVKKREARSGLRWLPPLSPSALMIGSIAPDVPLITIAIIFLLADWFGVRLVDAHGPAFSSNTAYLFRYMFFHEPGVKAAHNLFHAPLLVISYTGVGYGAWRTRKRWGPALFWFGLACALHTAIDIPLHYDDGPLLLFPFDWQTRFYSPISYWDPTRYGRPFAIFEHLLVLGMVIYLVVDWRRSRRTLSVETVGKQ
ncbi:MAG: metal-dependent hydrolase [Anaerolineaceae bacterium]|nr:metal-dependent hydrolase [Anaerolineaceae bacterium]